MYSLMLMLFFTPLGFVYWYLKWDWIYWFIKLLFSENVTEELHPKEVTDTEYRSGFSVALHLLLPVAGLIFVLFHQKNLLYKILLQIDRNCVAGKIVHQYLKWYILYWIISSVQNSYLFIFDWIVKYTECLWWKPFIIKMVMVIQ